MERKELIKKIFLVFSHLMRRTVNPAFKITNPEGGIAVRTMNACIDILQKEYGDSISTERIVDLCVCQVYAISRYERSITLKWGISQFFGKKAVERYKKNTKAHKYYEDKWLAKNDVNRTVLYSLIESQREHPQKKFIYPSYEDGTKLRMLNTEAGYYICGVSTLLWTPFSAVCEKCEKVSLCKERTQRTYPELYRLRVEEYKREKR